MILALEFDCQLAVARQVALRPRRDLEGQFGVELESVFEPSELCRRQRAARAAHELARLAGHQRASRRVDSHVEGPN